MGFLLCFGVIKKPAHSWRPHRKQLEIAVRVIITPVEGISAARLSSKGRGLRRKHSKWWNEVELPSFSPPSVRENGGASRVLDLAAQSDALLRSRLQEKGRERERESRKKSSDLVSWKESGPAPARLCGSCRPGVWAAAKGVCVRVCGCVCACVCVCVFFRKRGTSKETRAQLFFLLLFLFLSLPLSTTPTKPTPRKAIKADTGATRRLPAAFRPPRTPATPTYGGALGL